MQTVEESSSVEPSTEAPSVSPTRMDSWHSYPKVFALGHGAIRTLLDGPVVVQEKVDGSQFSFGKTEDGRLLVRSRGRVFPIDGADSLFQIAAERVLEIAPLLTPGWTYRGEYLAKPKHNSLAYDRVPRGNIILFDVSTGHEKYGTLDLIAMEAERLGLEAVPALWYGQGSELSPASIEEFLQRPSCLGGMIEGVVLKNYTQFSVDGHAMMGKYVSEKFKEVHGDSWKRENPTGGDVLNQLLDRYRSEARWIKAVQHLRERGELQADPRDIGPLIKEARLDFLAECEDEVKQFLWEWAKKKVLDKVTHGLPEWYRKQLLDGQFSP